ncbi:MAG: response regulator [Polyangiaceae bacterium]|nr:response regulator [Polyangiaceae bacterium]
MTKTLLAIDDSVTMRKVLEITFSGEDFRVITAENSQAAHGKLEENPSVFVIDTVLGAEDGYALAKEFRKRDPNAAIIMLASRHNPYDQGRGRDAGVDDWADKPFDTQQLIDKVRRIALGHEPAHAAAPAAPPHAYRAPAAPHPPPVAPPRATGAPAAPPVRTQVSVGASPTQPGQQSLTRSTTSTLLFGETHGAGAPAPSVPRPTSGATQGAVAAAVNGQLGSKLGELGLTPTQAEAVLTLSRDVVERVVWEVVPQLAETLIKEEIARLMKE